MEQHHASRQHALNEFRTESDQVRAKLKRDAKIVEEANESMQKALAELKHAVLQESISRDAAVAEVHRGVDEIQRAIESEARTRAGEDEAVKRDMVSLRELIC